MNHQQEFKLWLNVCRGDDSCVLPVQSSLLGLLLASRFFNDPLVSLPCGISTIFMTLVRTKSALSVPDQSQCKLLASHLRLHINMCGNITYAYRES